MTSNALRPAIKPFADTLAETPVSLQVLFDILQRPRFADTDGEHYVIDTYLRTIDGMQMDDFGSLLLSIPKADGSASETLFSCHTDTVHKKTATGTYKLAVDSNAMLKVAGGGVLGADDGTGIWIMLNLIAAEVPGTYIFHREEEIGGGGSLHIASEREDWLKTFKRAIAFDRKGRTDVITHQSFGRCCSDTFAQALADALNVSQGFTFRPDDGGTFTDTRNYTHLIPECTNLAIGYFDQHSLEETQDLSFATRLVNQLIALDWDALPAERDPAVEDEEDRYGNWYSDYHGGSYQTREISAETMARGDMIDLILDNPEEVADLLMHFGYDAYELARVIEGGA